MPKVVTQRCLEQDLNPRPTDRKPKCLTRCTTAPPPGQLRLSYTTEKLTRYPRKNPWTRSGLSSTESQTNSANVALYGSPMSAKFVGASIGPAQTQRETFTTFGAGPLLKWSEKMLINKTDKFLLKCLSLLLSVDCITTSGKNNLTTRNVGQCPT